MARVAKQAEHWCEERPWGRYEVLHVESENGFQVKRIELKTGGRLSLQSHAKRTEVWTVTSGQGVAVLDEKEIQVQEGSIITIPTGAKHRMANTGKEPLVFVEVQLGSYFGEDDIQRFQDDYNRS